MNLTGMSFDDNNVYNQITAGPSKQSWMKPTNKSSNLSIYSDFAKTGNLPMMPSQLTTAAQDKRDGSRLVQPSYPNYARGKE